MAKIRLRGSTRPCQSPKFTIGPPKLEVNGFPKRRYICLSLSSTLLPSYSRTDYKLQLSAILFTNIPDAEPRPTGAMTGEALISPLLSLFNLFIGAMLGPDAPKGLYRPDSPAKTPNSLSADESFGLFGICSPIARFNRGNSRFPGITERN